MTPLDCANDLTEILSKYGAAPNIGETNDEAYPKLLQCVKNMNKRIEKLDDAVKLALILDDINEQLMDQDCVLSDIYQFSNFIEEAVEALKECERS